MYYEEDPNQRLFSFTENIGIISFNITVKTIVDIINLMIQLIHFMSY